MRGSMAVLAVVAALAALGVLVVAQRHFVAHVPLEAPVAPLEVSGTGQHPPSSFGDRLIDRDQREGGGARARVEFAQEASRVLDCEGNGVGEVAIQWIALDPALTSGNRPRLDTDWDVATASTRRAISDALGAFAFSAPPTRATELSSVLWLTRAGFQATSIELAPGQPPPAEIALLPAPAAVVTVDGIDGRPVAGAEVTCYAAEVDGELAGASVYRDVATTGADGVARLAALPASVELEARVGNARSAPWRGRVTEPVVLILCDSFSISGTASVEDATELPAGGRIEVGLRGSHDSHVLRRLVLGATGEWLAEDLPRVEGAEVTIALRIPSYGPVDVVRPLPPTGGHVRIDLVARRGARLPVLVLGDDEQPELDATATIRWSRAGASGSVSLPVDDRGTAVFDDVPEGLVEVEARARGRVATRLGPFQITGGMDYGAVVVSLPPAGLLRGHCRQGGEPIPDFAVEYWQGPPDPTRKKIVSGSEDGSFELDEVPLGTVRIVAHASARPRSDIQTVQVEPGIVGEVLLELSPALVGVGRVVDGTTGERLAGARVEAQMCLDNILLDAVGPPTTTKADGSFRVEGLGAEVTGVAIRAPGYAEALLGARRADAVDGTIDLGRIALVRTGRLELRLDGSHVDLAGWSIAALGPTRIPSTPVSPEGVHVFEDIVPGTWLLTLSRPGHSNLTQNVHLEGSGPWAASFDVSPGGVLLVEVVDERPGGPRELAVRASCVVESRPFATRAQVPDEHGVFRLDGIRGEEAFLVVSEIRLSKHMPLVARRVALDGSAEQRVRVELAAAGQSLRVVDAQGAPVEGCRISVYGRDDPLAWALGVVTDVEGACSLAITPPESLSLTLSHDRLGTHLGVLLDVVDEEQVAEVVLAVEDRAVLVHERGVAQPHVRFELGDPTSPFELAPATADEHGVLQLRRIGGDLQATVAHPGYWPTTTLVRAGSGSTASVEVRRLGGLEIRARNVAGAAVPGARLTLISKEFGTDVATWVEEGKLRAPSELGTGPLGAVVVEGLPNGEYSWTLDAPDGASASGSATVPPGGLERVDAFLDAP